MFEHTRRRALLGLPAVFLIVTCLGCSGSLDEGDGTQTALDTVNQSYPDPAQIVAEVTSTRRRRDSGLTVEISVTPVDQDVRPNVHEIDMTPDGTVVSHSKNGEDVPIEE